MGDVADDEFLFRSIRAAECKRVSGVLRISASAFNDKGRKPSVDRAQMVADVAECKLTPSDGIAQIIAAEVRSLAGIRVAPNAKDNLDTYDVDVWSRPLTEKPWHAQVEATPDITKTHFEKLKEALARLAAQRDLVVDPLD